MCNTPGIEQRVGRAGIETGRIGVIRRQQGYVADAAEIDDGATGARPAK